MRCWPWESLSEGIYGIDSICATDFGDVLRFGCLALRHWVNRSAHDECRSARSVYKSHHGLHETIPDELQAAIVHCGKPLAGDSKGEASGKLSSISDGGPLLLVSDRISFC